jgi:hypothetical protein
MKIVQGSIGPLGPHSSDDAVAHGEARPREDGLDPLRKPTSRTNPRCVAICTVGELFGGVERHVLGIMSGLVAEGVSTMLALFHDGELAAQACLCDRRATEQNKVFQSSLVEFFGKRSHFLSLSHLLFCSIPISI